MSDISLIEFPFNLGLKEPSSGQEPGVRRLPAWLRKYDFHNLIEPVEVETLQSPVYQMNLDDESGILNADAIVDYAKKSANLLNKVFAEKKFPLVIGGDCSIMVGNALALRQKGNYGVFYLDGHTDFIEPDVSQTGAAGGMAAALIAGIGPKKLTNINGQGPYIEEEHLWCVGNREYDEKYESRIRNSQASYYSLAALREVGINNCVNAFFEMIHAQKLDGFWIHIDVDVLDDKKMPAVDSRTPGGLSYQEFNHILMLLLSNQKGIGMEITILDPDLDPSGLHTKEFVYNFVHTFNDTIKSDR